MTFINQYKEALVQNIEDAKSLPFKAYTSPEIFNLELEKVFHSDWFFVCSSFDIPEKGDYKVVDLAGESIVIMRTEDGSISALSNYCRHKGTQLLDNGVGSAKKIVCPYHTWTYCLNGELKGVPFPGKIDVKKKDHCLPHFKVEQWQNLVFVNLDGKAESLSNRYAGINKYLEAFDYDRFKFSYQGKEEIWNCNWKVAMENAMESYHLFTVHAETLEKRTPTKKAFYVEGGVDWSLTGGEILGIGKTLTSLFSGNKYDYLNNYILVSLAPSFVGILTYESFDWIQILPMDEGRVKVFSGGISPHEGEASKSSIEFTKKFFLEDKVICERVQNSMYTAFGKPGKLVELEQIVVDFRQFIANRVFDAKITRQDFGERAQEFLGK